MEIKGHKKMTKMLTTEQTTPIRKKFKQQQNKYPDRKTLSQDFAKAKEKKKSLPPSIMKSSKKRGKM